ncbi:hypothetical protein KY334_03030 [Candidatus Woesearchaeota archaeon]|nr:hypothetical protein [Candidatus Woesearchaeota archaeon]
MKEELKKRLQEYCKGNDFILNDNEEFLDKVLDGLVMKKEKEGQFFCPCRFANGENKTELLCPCNFKVQENWNSRKECWCGLFKKKD